MIELKNKIAVLIGVAKDKSIGAAIAKKLAAAGCNLVLTCAKNIEYAELLSNTCKMHNIESSVFMQDATIESNNFELSNFVSQKFGKLDFLINCLGITRLPVTVGAFLWKLVPFSIL